MNNSTTTVPEALLKAAEKLSNNGKEAFAPGEAFRVALESLQGNRPVLPQQEKWDLQAAILAYWNDLIRSGVLGLGNPGTGDWQADACFLTATGRKTLELISSDPSNPDGYMYLLKQMASLDPVADSYIQEALHTYKAGCFKATAVMVGTAAEGMILNLRDVIVARLRAASITVPKELDGWRIKAVCDELETLLEANRKRMPPEVSREYDTHWAGFVSHIRAIRNSSGHPNSIEPVTPQSVHAALLIFPEFMRLIGALEKWAVTHNF